MRRFIYLDTDTLNSYIAQIYDGLVQTQETETQSSQATDKQSEYTSDLGADADLKVFGKGIEGKMDFTYRPLTLNLLAMYRLSFYMTTHSINS